MSSAAYSPNAIAVLLYAKVPYDETRDFAPITRIGMTPNIIVVHPSTPFKSIKQQQAIHREFQNTTT